MDIKINHIPGYSLCSFSIFEGISHTENSFSQMEKSCIRECHIIWFQSVWWGLSPHKRKLFLSVFQSYTVKLSVFPPALCVYLRSLVKPRCEHLLAPFSTSIRESSALYAEREKPNSDQHRSRPQIWLWWPKKSWSEIIKPAICCGIFLKPDLNPEETVHPPNKTLLFFCLSFPRNILVFWEKMYNIAQKFR